MPRKYTRSPNYVPKPKLDPAVSRKRAQDRKKARLAYLKQNDPTEYARRRERSRVIRRESAMRRGPIDRSTVKGRLLLLLKRARKRAVAAGLEWNIGVRDIHMPTHCPVLGIPLSTTPGERGANRFSLDRSDSRKGYVKGNVQIISFRANTLKNNATAAELRAVAEYVAGLEAFAEILS